MIYLLASFFCEASCLKQNVNYVFFLYKARLEARHGIQACEEAIRLGGGLLSLKTGGNGTGSDRLWRLRSDAPQLPVRNTARHNGTLSIVANRGDFR